MSNEEINILIQILENAREVEPGSNPRSAFLVEVFFIVADKMRPSSSLTVVGKNQNSKRKNNTWSPERRAAASQRMRDRQAKKHAAGV